MQTKKSSKAKKIIDAVVAFKKLKNYAALAEILNVAPSTISTWIDRDKVNADKIFRVCEGINYDFLLTGEGQIAATPAPQKEIIEAPPQKQDSLADFYEYAAVSLRVLFDFIADEYGRDSVALLMFLRDQERLSPAYRAWLVQKKDSFAGLRGDGRNSRAA